MEYPDEGDEKVPSRWLTRLGFTNREDQREEQGPQLMNDREAPEEAFQSEAWRLSQYQEPAHSAETDHAGNIHSDAPFSSTGPDHHTIETDNYSKGAAATDQLVSEISIQSRLAELRQEALLNFGEMNLLKQVFEHTVEHSEIEYEYLLAVKTIFAEPEDFEELYDRLRETGSVLVLNVPPGHGRSITAHALLAHLYTEGYIDGARELSFGGSSEFPVRRLPHERKQGFILELPADEEENNFQVSGRFGSRLDSLSHELKKRDNRLIILTRPEQWRRIGMGAPSEVAPEYASAEATRIAERWLLAEDPSFPVHLWLNDAEIKKLFVDATPLDALQIVDLILKACHADASTLPSLEALTRRQDTNTGGGGDEFQRQVLSVVAARHNWRRQLLDWHKKSGRTSFERNFLLAASVLRNAPVAHVYAKVAVLCQTLSDEDIRITGQQAPGVIELVDAIDAELSDAGIILFSRPGWDDAVLEYFWIDRPLARPQFLEWLATAPVKNPQGIMETISFKDREALASRISEFALGWAVRYRRQEPLKKLAEAWFAQSKSTSFWSVLISLLSSAAVRDASAPYIHAMLLNWSKTKSPALQKAVVEICAGEFGRVHTGKALRRLKNAGESVDFDVIEALRGAVQNLWQDPSVRQTLFGYVVDWCRNTDTDALAGRRAFAILARTVSSANPALPVLLDYSEEAEFSPPANGLSVGWRALLSHESMREESDEAAMAVSLWMTAALQDGLIRKQVLDALRRAVDGTAADGSQRRRDLLRTYVIKWYEEGDMDSRPLREALYSQLSQQIDHDLRTEMTRQLREVSEGLSN